jgi:uncharacterized FAD-dependent dehydrogenase
MLRINNIKMPLNADVEELRRIAAEKLGCTAANLHNFKVAKKSVDARNKQNVHFVYSIDCEPQVQVVCDKDAEQLLPEEKLVFDLPDDGVRPVVVGSGPAGMFAGIALAEAGLRPIILERGADVDAR